MPKYLKQFKLKVNEEVLKSTVHRAKERNIIIPTFAQQKNPEQIPEKVKKQVKPLGLWDVDPRNLFRITWKNDTKTGLYGDVNFVELPSSLTGVKARIVGLVDLPGQGLQPAEGAEGLGLGVDALLEGGGDALVGAGDGVGHGAVSDKRRRGW